jgi:hypothetical protein
MEQIPPNFFVWIGHLSAPHISVYLDSLSVVVTVVDNQTDMVKKKSAISVTEKRTDAEYLPQLATHSINPLPAKRICIHWNEKLIFPELIRVIHDPTTMFFFEIIGRDNKMADKEQPLAWSFLRPNAHLKAKKLIYLHQYPEHFTCTLQNNMLPAFRLLEKKVV